MQFPYMRLYHSDKDIKEMFEKLKKYNYKDRLLYDNDYVLRSINIKNPRYMNRSIILLSKDSDYNDFNKLSSMFTDECRMRCRVYKVKLSPYEYYVKNEKKILEECKVKYGNMDLKNQREVLYKSVKECTSFRPTNMIAFIDMFNVKSILDFSAGWGDRLIGFLASKADVYYGIDPNKCVYNKYKDIIDYFKVPKKKVYLMNVNFEEADIKGTEVDLVFTSPPYFDLEDYVDDNNKSIIKYKDEGEWFSKFLKIALLKAWGCINSGGHMALCINQRKDNIYIYKMMSLMKRLEDCTFLGIISYSSTELKNPQPIFVYKKMKK